MAELSSPLVLVSHTLPDEWLSSLKDKCQTVIRPVDATYLDPKLESLLGEAEGLFSLLTIKVDVTLLKKRLN